MFHDHIAFHLRLPKPAPLKDTAAPPLRQAFVPDTPDTTPASYDAPYDNVPAPTPSVTDTTRLPSKPSPTLHTREVSDTHVVACEADRPIRPAPQNLRIEVKRKDTALSQEGKRSKIFRFDILHSLKTNKTTRKPKNSRRQGRQCERREGRIRFLGTRFQSWNTRNQDQSRKT